VEAAAGVHEEAADAGFIHEVDLAGQFGDFQAIIPAPEGYGAVFGGGIGGKLERIHGYSWFGYGHWLFGDPKAENGGGDDDGGE